MADCTECTYAVYDELWGEYKCTKKQINVFPTELYKDCKDYKKIDPKKKNTQD